ncbi:hypothetical protein DP113_30355 [Brasilonema octagenarum UFV-E1]|uniref:AAA+ ATPase domain-containing protein n=1 Tax=Brasilonema sennae CENA114 TaxID=415709 RepID=A0A856MNC3_9CYAN|nr:NB-ARC domain-containing protein [Brasilonema sennae]QDL11604.1 hypothetical protein DP114_30215 [Brasilonema sennae CENA114]QDL17982.1 hypothetical protein DP113_30355 [Brasilonema octagenarum UFV-E1]
MVSTQEPFSEAANNWDLERLYIDLADAKRQVAPPRAKPGLTEVEKTHLRGLLCRYHPEDIANRLNKDRSGIVVDLSRTLYRYTEKLTNREEKTLRHWGDIANWLEAAGYKTTEPPAQQIVDWGEAPEVSVFHGRNTELETLNRWIVSDRCRVVAIIGMAGIGKTTIAVRIAEQIQDEFEYLVWRALPDKPPPLSEILLNIISFLSDEQSTDSSNNVDDLISKLLKVLRQHRVLLILDNWETVLGGDGAGRYQPGYEKYGELLQRIAQQNHKSCLVLTSQERPETLTSCEGTTVKLRKLEGLDEVAATEIFRTENLKFAAEDATRLINMYRGNPLALIHISKMIQELFDGSVTEFLRINTIVVPPPIEMLLRQRLERLPEWEKEILCCLASEAIWLDSDTVRSRMSSEISTGEFLQQLYSLCQRSFIEKCKQDGKVLFTLQPVVSKCVQRYFNGRQQL